MNAIILLLILAVGLCFIEIFAPGGIFAAIGAVLVLIASVIGFAEYGVRVGMYILVGGGIVGVLLFFLEMKLLLGTSFGASRFAHLEVNSSRTGFDAPASLLGRSGKTITRMVPGGKIEIDGTVYPAVSIDGYMAKGTAVVVSEADAFAIKISTES